MLIIRLQRTGKKNQADFRIVLAEKAAPVNKKITEILGSYNPRKKTFQVTEERVKYWLEKNVALSETMHNLFVTKGLKTGPKVKAFTTPKKAAEPVAPPAASSSPAAEVALEAAEVAKVEAPEQPIAE
jgi:small subunit ribosomal protein S16